MVSSFPTSSSSTSLERLTPMPTTITSFVDPEAAPTLLLRMSRLPAGKPAATTQAAPVSIKQVGLIARNAPLEQQHNMPISGMLF